MPRRRESLFDVLTMLPWWIGFAVGAVGYGVIAWLLPAIWTDVMLGAVAKGIQPIRWIWLMLCWTAAGASALHALLIRRKFDQQRGLDDVRQLSWQQFEMVVGEAFRRRGYQVIETGGGGADGGVDLVLRKEGKKHYVQCKQWKTLRVGVKPVRELFGVMQANGVDGGVFVCSGSYSPEAQDFARKAGIELIDGLSLERMIKPSRLESDPAPTNEETALATPKVGDRAPMCPFCSSTMTKRIARRGANAGNAFWGCMQFPRCRGTRPI